MKDPRLFAVKLDNIIFGADKIHVNLPRFEREKNVVRQAGKATVNAVSNKGIRKVWREVKENQAEGKATVEVFAPKESSKGEVSAPRNKEEANKRGGSLCNNGRGEVKSFTKGRLNKGRWMDRQQHHDQKVVYFRKKNICDVWYNASEEELSSFKKMYVGVMKDAGSTHMVQEWFSMQGFFSVKVTPMGANLVLLEEMEEGIIPALIEDASDWIHEKFDDIRKWSQSEVDNERLVWVRCHGIPVHAWNNEFFSAIARKFGTFLGVDENTRKNESLDLARILIRTKDYDVFNMVLYANINGSMFHIKVLEEWCGPMRWDGLTQAKKPASFVLNSSSDDDSEDGDGPPLFGYENGEDDSSGDEEEEVEVVGANLLEGNNVIQQSHNNDEFVRVVENINDNNGELNGVLEKEAFDIQEDAEKLNCDSNKWGKKKTALNLVELNGDAMYLERQEGGTHDCGSGINGDGISNLQATLYHELNTTQHLEDNGPIFSAANPVTAESNSGPDRGKNCVKKISLQGTM